MTHSVAAQRSDERPTKPSGHVSATRTDIQGLRAIAVTAVVVYHVWPHELSGGYAGVDVFFVISGFLITSHLVSTPPDGPRRLIEFWSRRLRRLLPAALTVLLATLVASRVFAPATKWETTADQVRAAALYVQNWRLAHDAVDYLASNNAATPVQHYWSLSVEEQFYLVWPVLLLVLWLVARAARTRVMPIVGAGLAAVVLASLWYSIHETDVDQAKAYFVTPARVWELGIGALLAVLVSPNAFGRRRTLTASSQVLRVALALSGIAAMIVTFVIYTDATAFPGWKALLPTLGCAAVIAANDPRGRLAPGRVLAVWPVQRLGDISYSLYLWHWPLVVLLPEVSGHLGWLDKTTIIVVSLALATLSKRFLEDPFRRPKWGKPLIKPYLLAALGMAVVVSGTFAQVHEVHRREAKAKAEVASAQHGSCFGARALAAGSVACPATTSGTIYPDPLTAKNDVPAGFNGQKGQKDCFALMPKFDPVTCTIGSSGAKVHIAIVGNSHAYELVPALDVIAAKYHWQITTYFAQRCVYSDVTKAAAKVQSAQQLCYQWVHWATKQLTSHDYDLTMIVNRSVAPKSKPVYSPDASEYEQGYVNVLDDLRSAKRRVLAIRDTPSPSTEIPDCLSEHTSDYSKCNGTRSSWLVPDPIAAAIASMHEPTMTEADLTPDICEPVVCQAVVGAVPVYFDNSHLTATYARTLAPVIGTDIARALR